MPVALALKSIICPGRSRTLTYKATFSGTYPTGGDTCDFTGATNPNFVEHAIPDHFPSKDEVAFDDTAAGYTAEWVPGTTLANGKIKFYSAAGTEVTNATYPVALSGDDLYVVVVQSLGKSKSAL